VHRNLQDRYANDFIRPTARGIAREMISGFTAEQIYGEERAELETQMQARISELMAVQGLQLIDLLLRDIAFSDAFSASIEQALVAQQEAQQAQRRVEQRQAEARQAVAVAEGARDANIARAQGEARDGFLEGHQAILDEEVLGIAPQPQQDGKSQNRQREKRERREAEDGQRAEEKSNDE